MGQLPAPSQVRTTPAPRSTPTPTPPLPPATHDPRGSIALVLSLVALIIAVGSAWYTDQHLQRFMEADRRGPARVIPAIPSAAPTAPAALETPSTPPSPQEKWLTVQSLTVPTKKGTVQIRHDCNQAPEAVSFDGAAYKGTACFGTNRLVLIDPQGKERVILPARVLPTDEDGHSLAPLLFSATVQNFSNNKQDVLISFDADSCSSVGDCGAGQPTPRVTFVYSVDEDKTTAITPIGDRQTLVWGGDRRAVLLDLTCGGAGCDNPQALHGFNLNTNTLKTITTLKADWNNGQPTGDTGIGRATAHWESVTWIDATHAEAVYVGADDKKQTIPLVF